MGASGRQTYVITDAGRAALRQWLALPFHNEPPRNEFLLKLFFAGEASPDVAIAHIQDLNERNRRWLVTIKPIEASIPAGAAIESSPALLDADVEHGKGSDLRRSGVGRKGPGGA